MSTDRQRDADMDRLLRATLGREPAVAPGACLDAGMLAAIVEGGVPEDERNALEAHLAVCGRCQDVLAAMDLDTPASPAAAPVPASAARRPWLWRGHLHWLIPVGAGALLVVYVASRPAIAPSFQPVGPPLTFPPPGPASTQMAELRQAESPAAGMPATPPPPATLTREKNAAPARAPETASETAPARSTGERSAGAKADVAPAEMPVPAAPPAAIPATGTPVIAPAPAAAQAIAADAVPQAGAQQKGIVAERALRTAATEVVEVSAPGGAIHWRVGAAGTIWRSADEGRTWYPQRSGVKTALLAAAAPSISTCWAVGADGIVLLTDDGERWERRPFPEPTDLVAVEARSAHEATVTTRDGRRFATPDRGATWALQRQLP